MRTLALGLFRTAGSSVIVGMTYWFLALGGVGYFSAGGGTLEILRLLLLDFSLFFSLFFSLGSLFFFLLVSLLNRNEVIVA